MYSFSFENLMSWLVYVREIVRGYKVVKMMMMWFLKIYKKVRVGDYWDILLKCFMKGLWM